MADRVLTKRKKTTKPEKVYNGKVVVINKGPALMANMMVSILNDFGTGAVRIGLNVDQIKEQKEDADIFMLFTGEVVYTSQEALTYLKEVSFSEGKPLYVLGYRKELDELEAIIPSKFIAKEFERPADFKNIALQLSTAINVSMAQRPEKSILLVDDDTMFLQTLQSWFRDDYEVTATTSGMQAIMWLATHTPDLILLDYDMPITAGPQVLEMIRSDPNSADIPVIFLTGRDDRESVEKVMSLRPEGYLLKALSREEIMNTIENFFNKKKWENINKR
ncbi:MAG: response regulator [Clostridia bacterium]|nr:response regulator [Clostridia bacterium]